VAWESETRALEEPRWERKKNLESRPVAQLSNYRPWPPSVEPSRSNLLTINPIY